jgi:Gas vesicle synthesis protein GvpO
MAERRSTPKRSSSGSSGGSGSSGSRSSTNRSSGSSSGRRSPNGSSKRRSNSKLSGPEAITRARESATEMLGRPVESVLGLEPDDGNGWKVTVEVVELERIPRSTDVLGAYVMSLDKSGELTAARRERRYYRNQADEE